MEQKTVLLIGNTSQIDLQILINPYCNPSLRLCTSWQSDSKIYMGLQGTESNQDNLEKEEQSWKLSNFKTYNKVRVIMIGCYFIEIHT